MTDTATSNADAVLFDIRPAVAWVSDIQKSILVEGAKFFRGQNPAQGSAISYWLKNAATEDVRITINDVTGREIRALVGTKNAGLNRVQWDLRATPAGGRGRGQGGGGGQAAPPAEAGAPAAQPAAAAQAQGAPDEALPRQQPRLKAPAVAGAVVAVGAEAAFKDRPSQPEPTS